MLHRACVAAPVEFGKVVEGHCRLFVAHHFPQFGDIDIGGDALTLLAEVGYLLVAVREDLRGEDDALGRQARLFLAANGNAHARGVHIDHPYDGYAAAHAGCYEFVWFHEESNIDVQDG